MNEQLLCAIAEIHYQLVPDVENGMVRLTIDYAVGSTKGGYDVRVEVDGKEVQREAYVPE